MCLPMLFLEILSTITNSRLDEATEVSYMPLNDEVSVSIQKYCKESMPAGEMVVNPPGVVLTNNYQKYTYNILNMEVRQDDIWVISFPKSGSTWTQEMVWLLKNGVQFDKAETYLWERFLFLEYKGICAENNHELDPFEEIHKIPEGTQRFIKTHLPIDLLPKQVLTKKPKIIYITRNPNDVAVSYFYHFQVWNNYVGSKELFWNAFLEDKVVFSPYWRHVLSYWNLRHTYDNILYIRYEDMKKDLATVMKQVCEFLEESCPQGKKLEQLLDHLSFDKMQINNWVNFKEDIKLLHPEDLMGRFRYMRKGEVGSWKNEFSPELVQKFADWTDKHLAGTDYQRNPLE